MGSSKDGGGIGTVKKEGGAAGAVRQDKRSKSASAVSLANGATKSVEGDKRVKGEGPKGKGGVIHKRSAAPQPKQTSEQWPGRDNAATTEEGVQEEEAARNAQGAKRVTRKSGDGTEATISQDG